MRTKIRRKQPDVTQKRLRTIARKFLATFIAGDSSDVNRRDAALQVLHAPERRRE